MTQSEIIILTYPGFKLCKSGYLVLTYPGICKSRHLILGHPNLRNLYLDIPGCPVWFFKFQMEPEADSDMTWTTAIIRYSATYSDNHPLALVSLI